MVKSMRPQEETRTRLGKTKFVIFTGLKRSNHMPHRATGEMTGFGQVTEDGVRGEPEPEPLLGFLWERQGRAE